MSVFMCLFYISLFIIALYYCQLRVALCEALRRYIWICTKQLFDWSVVVFPAVCVARQQIGRKDCVP